MSPFGDTIFIYETKLLLVFTLIFLSQLLKYTVTCLCTFLERGGGGGEERREGEGREKDKIKWIEEGPGKEGEGEPAKRATR